MQGEIGNLFSHNPPWASLLTLGDRCANEARSDRRCEGVCVCVCETDRVDTAVVRASYLRRVARRHRSASTLLAVE